MENKIFKDYKKFIASKSKFAPKVLEYTIDTYFPIIVVEDPYIVDIAKDNMRMNVIQTVQYTVNIYAIDDHVDGMKYPRKAVAKELANLTIEFFCEHLDFMCTFNDKTPNVDDDIYRKTLRFERNLNSKLNLFM